MDEDRCEECRKLFEEGDDVTFVEPADASNRPTRIWHTECLDRTIRPLKDLQNATVK